MADSTAKNDVLEGTKVMKQRAIVIGGGLGGMAAALTLSPYYEVHLFEKNDWLGGKMQAIQLGAHHFDYGPNTLTMPRYFWETIAPFCDAQKELPFKKLQNPTHHKWAQHELTFTTNREKMQQQLAVIDETSAQNYPAFLAEVTRLFHISEQAFLTKTFFSAKDYVSPTLAYRLLQAHPWKTLDAFLKSFFPHPAVRQLFGRFATYIGSSPYASPATFALIAYFELVDGTYYLRGGATTIARVFEKLLKRQHVHLHLQESVEKIAIDDQRIVFCETTKQRYGADIIISDIDYVRMQQLLGRDEVTYELSTSAYVELIALKEPVSLHYHNVQFSADYPAEFQALRLGTLPNEATVYSCYPFAADQQKKPALFVLINAPATTNMDLTLAKNQVERALKIWGIEETQIIGRQVVPPDYVAQTFNVAQGAIYGQASNTLRGSFLRPANRDRQLKNLYFVGGTVHPGGGSPIVVKGGYEVANRIILENSNCIKN